MSPDHLGGAETPDVDRVVAESPANHATREWRLAAQRLVTQAAGATLVFFERLDQSVERPGVWNRRGVLLSGWRGREEHPNYAE